MMSPLWPLFKTFSVQEVRHHPWRNMAAVVAVMLGVALAFSVHLINSSALDEFSQAVRSIGGQPDLQLRTSGLGTNLDDSVLQTLREQPEVAVASPVLELSTYALSGTGAAPARVLLRVLGVDPLQIAALAPDLLPMPSSTQARTVVFEPKRVFLNAAARVALGGGMVQLMHGMQAKSAEVAGNVQAGGAPLAVMDIAAAQDLFDKGGQLTRVDLRLQPGTDREAFARRMQANAHWAATTTLAPAVDAATRIDNLSRAYRVNLTVLALIALFTGGFLVFSVTALSVARRSRQLALLAVLGLTGRQRLYLVLLEALALGLLGSALGLALGTGLAATALRLLGADLGGGIFAGLAPTLQWNAPAAAVFAALGLATALTGAWWPANQAKDLPPAQTLKGLGLGTTQPARAWVGPTLLGAAALLAQLPPISGIPLAAYLSVALLLVGGIASLPWLVGLVLDRVAPWVAHQALPLLAVERARRVRDSAAVAVSGVVASLSLAVALTVMVGSFRNSVTTWLDTVLPASLYLRSAANSSANDLVFFDDRFVREIVHVPGVERITVQRTVPLMLDATKPAVSLIVRNLREDGQSAPALPWVSDPVSVPPGQIGIYVSEAMVDLYGAKVGSPFSPIAQVFANATAAEAQRPAFFVAGVWRDYARQFGTVAMDRTDFATLSGDARINDIALWLEPQASVAAVEQAVRAMADRLAETPDGQAGALLEFGSAAQIRATTLRIFDRSFAVTYWLQAVAVGIGLFGVAASFSAQVLARSKEFGLLAHLGLTRRQILRVVATEGAAWTGLGAIAGLGLGLAVSVVLVHVVNPQSFHWTMELSVSWWRLLGLAGAVIAAGTLTAWLSGRSAAGHDAVMAVKEDW